jgi:hypothetical protein
LNAASIALDKKEAELRGAIAERDAVAREIALIEDQVVSLLEAGAPDGEARLDLSGRTILYVGARAHQIPQFKALVERTRARFLHHDGGIEHSATLLPGLISRADRCSSRSTASATMPQRQSSGYAGN